MELPYLPPVTMTFLGDPETGRYYVTVTIDGEDHELGSYATANEAGARMQSWVTQRGLRFGRDSAHRLDEAQRLDLDLVTFDVIEA